MNQPAERSEVKHKVRHNALLLQEFTVEELVRVTALNRSSVHTELQRMKKEGLVAVGAHPSKPKERLYRLTDDSETRLELVRSVEAFYTPPPAHNYPTSRFYLIARNTLDQAQTVEFSKREALLAEAEDYLEVAGLAEGEELASEQVQAYLSCERFRLAYLRNEFDGLAEQLETLREFFVVQCRDDKVITVIDDLLVSLNIQQRLHLADTTTTDEVHRARCVLDSLDEVGYTLSSPVTALVLDTFRSLLQSVEQLGRVRIVNMTLHTYDMTMQMNKREVAHSRVKLVEQPTPRVHNLPNPSYPGSQFRQSGLGSHISPFDKVNSLLKQ